MSSLEPAQRPRIRASTAVLVAAPALVGVAAAIVLLVAVPHLDLGIWITLWGAALAAGLLVTAVMLVRLAVQSRIARAYRAGFDEAHRVASEGHHQFLLRLDHELKNPVTAIQAGLANLAGLVDGTRDSGASAAFDSLSIQTQRVADLVADLRKLAELETRPIEQDPVDLAEVLAEVRDAALELTGDDERTIALTLPQAPWPLASVPGDRDLLFLAFYNLLANALKFTDDADTIEIRAHDDGSHVAVEVADTGIGIPDDEVDDVWNELARGRAARGTAGMGLGLSMVRVVVTRHGGTVSVRSREGHGTVMSVRLPAAVGAA
ncbi:sensor histidine kinase [Actinobacteria bacterium YIM 96077]|uniref:histidine kinase n=1 Tax=Phytoactinopolyspora halophila TaxID=1981511 RepID=A0A329QLG9_9ACTN|nr:HAMP domain-containing sensor histidine kinase [Phytoactinopolyspora halophila]AYY12961.1 sensor histidine kinase [Actinobacteria bacterium YIM 96077]RAW13225.1 sensor histidine kinase [Phytoactinopolyspora halophila]